MVGRRELGAGGLEGAASNEAEGLLAGSRAEGNTGEHLFFSQRQFNHAVSN